MKTKANHLSWFSVICICQAVALAWGQSGALDITFDPQIEQASSVYAIAVQPDGKVIVGGGFTRVNGSARSAIARLNSDGTLDASFNAPVLTGWPNSGLGVFAITLQPDGKILVGGVIKKVAGRERNGIIRLNPDGNVDEGFGRGPGINPDITPRVDSIAVQSDGKILIGGQFFAYDGIPRNRLARLNSDGTLDTNFAPPPLSGIGGTAPNVKRILVRPDGEILIAGFLGTVTDTPSHLIARLHSDGTVDTSFHPGAWVGEFLSTVANSIALQNNGKLLVVGSFSTVGYEWNDVARLNIDGSVDTSFKKVTPFKNLISSVLLLPDGKILIGGNFDSPRPKLARLDSDGGVDSEFNPTWITDLVLPNSQGIGAMTAQTDGRILLGGSFGLVRMNADGSLDNAFTPRISESGVINSVSVQASGKVVIVGRFNSVEGIFRPGIARLNSDGSLDVRFDPGTGLYGQNFFWSGNDRGLALESQPDGKVIFGGGFSKFNGVARNNIVRLNSDGSLDATFDLGQGPNYEVKCVATQPDGKILLGGYFSSIDGVSQERLARLNSDGKIDSSFKVSVEWLSDSFRVAVVKSLLVQPDGKIFLGGTFSKVSGVLRTNIARLNRDGSVDLTFDPASVVPPEFDVQSMVLQRDGRILLGPIRLNADGSADSDFHTQTPVSIYTFAAQSDGRILVGGYGTKRGVVIARLHNDGSLDNTFDAGPRAKCGDDFAGCVLYGMAVQLDGKLLVGGQITEFDGVPRNGIARLLGDRVQNTFGSPAKKGEAFEFDFKSEAGKRYIIQLSPDLQSWFDMTNFTGTGTTLPLRDSSATTQQKRFYRAVSP